MRVQEIMTDDVATVGPDEIADRAWSQMAREGRHHLVVVEDTTAVGMLSSRDLDGATDQTSRPVRELMMPVTTADTTTSLQEAADLMREHLLGWLPVVEEGDVVGMVTATDVLEELGHSPEAARPAAGKITGRLTATRGRQRVREPDSTMRAPMPGRLPRPAKRQAGRTTTPETPAHIRSVGGLLDDQDREYLRRKLGRKLGKFGTSIERVSVRVEDVNGPRGGVDKRCRIKVVLSGLPSVVVDSRDHSLQAAMDDALGRVERAVRQAQQRRLQKPLKSRRRPAAAPR